MINSNELLHTVVIIRYNTCNFLILFSDSYIIAVIFNVFDLVNYSTCIPDKLLLTLVTIRIFVNN